MTTKLLSILVAAACTSLAGGAIAEDVTVSADLGAATVRVGNEVTLTVTVQGKFRRAAEPELPALDDFDVYNAGTSQNFSMINGRIQSSVSYRYVLVPKKEGVYKIGPVKFTLKDKEYTASPVTLEVVAVSASLQPKSAAPGTRQKENQAETGEKADRSIFIQAETDRDTVYVNQQVTWTLGYYSDGRITLVRSPNYTPPEAEGLWVEDLPPQNKYYATLNGRQYLVNEIKRGYFPTSSGTFEIGPAKVDVVVDDIGRRRADDFFNRSFWSRGFGRSQTLVTEEKKIVVLPLPARGRPVGFGGVVAEGLTLSMSADKQVVQVGEPVNLSIVLNGRGNMKTVAPPKLAGVESFKVYESGSHFDVFKKEYVVTGRKKYDLVIVPKTQGRHTIAAVELPYFDPVRKTYLVARSHPVNLDVQPGAKEEGRKIIYAGTGDDFEVISQDIRFIHPVPSVIASSQGIGFGGRLLLAAHAVPLLALMVSLAVEKRRRRYRGNVSLARASRALRDAEKKLAAARNAFRSGDVEAGFAWVSGAVSGYIADKMNTAAAGLTVESVEDYLRRSGADEETTASVRRVVAACDAARFAAGTAGGATPERGFEVAAQARDVLRSLERRYFR